MNNKKISFFGNLLKICGISLTLLCYSYKCPASPVWHVYEGEDMIGIAGNGPEEFMDFNPEPPVPPVIEYHVGDDWIKFPYKLKNKAHSPHTVHICFDTNIEVSPRNLVLGVDSDAPLEGQHMAVYFNDQYIGKEIIDSNYKVVFFWLGVIEKGSHKIIITNDSPIAPIDPNDPNTYTPGYGIRFDFIQLISPDFKTINIPEDCQTITEGIQEANPGDTIYVKKGIYKENKIELKSGLTLMGESPEETIIDGEGKTVIIGAYQSQIKGFTIRNGGLIEDEDQGVGIRVFDDFMSLSNNIILSCKIGVSLTGQDLNLVNNTMAQNDCSLHVLRSDANAPLPSLKCKNNIFSDSNYAFWIYSDTNTSFGIDPNEFDKVVEDFSFNNIFTGFHSNVDFIEFGKGNIQTNPFFVDTNMGNYHLMPYSLCIDSGDPNSDFSEEPVDNGQRINMGAFGNTKGATRTLDSDGDGIRDYDEGIKDRDLDGQQDWIDHQTSVFISTSANKEIWICLENDANDSLSLAEVGTVAMDDPLISEFDLPSIFILYGFWRFKVDGLDHGSKVPIEIHFPQRLFEFQEYFFLDPDYGWEIISTKENNSENFITIQLYDGGIGDSDKTINGSITHIGGISSASPFHEDPESINCFIQTLKGGNQR